MKNGTVTSWQKFFALTLVSLCLTLSCAGFNLLPTATAATTVKQPDIIPQEAITSQGKVYIPYNASGESTKGYLENKLLPGIAATIIGLTGGLALLFTVISGIMLLVSYGNPDMAGKARKTLVYSLIGVMGAGLSYAIVAIIASINP